MTALGWVVVALLGALAVTQAIGFDRARAMSIAQTFTPLALAGALPIAVAAAIAGEVAMAVVAAAIVAALVVLAAPLVRRRRAPVDAPHGDAVRILHANLLAGNPAGADIARELASIDADVLALTEYTFEHAAAFGTDGFAERYPHRVELPHRGPPGIAVLSRIPFHVSAAPDTALPWIDLVVEPTGSAPLRIVVVHTSTPVFDHGDWRAELALLHDVARPGTTPTVVVGDFNATWWHPGFRRLLRATRLRNAHVDVGRGWSASWPADRRVPPFARLDHALVDATVAVVDVVDVPVPGSDHRGFVVTVRAAR